MTRYRLPDDVFDGEEHEGRPTTFAGEPWVFFDADGVRFYVEESALTEVKPTLPEEPPYKAVVVDGDGQAWQRFMERPAGKPGWFCAGDGADENWEGLQQYAPLTRLVPDPFTEPVELPVQFVCAATKDDTLEIAGPDDDDQIPVRTLGLGTVYLDPSQARRAAGALWAAADQAEAQS